MLGTHVCIYTGADPEGGAAGARPLLFVPNSLKSPLNWLKFVKKACVDEPPNPLRPFLFQILDPPLIHDIYVKWKKIFIYVKYAVNTSNTYTANIVLKIWDLVEKLRM